MDKSQVNVEYREIPTGRAKIAADKVLELGMFMQEFAEEEDAMIIACTVEGNLTTFIGGKKGLLKLLTLEVMKHIYDAS